MTSILHIPVIFGVSIEVYFILLAIGIPVFFICRWLLKLLIKTEKPIRIATWAITIMVTPLIYIGLASLWILTISYHPKHEFDKEKWFASKEKRYELSNDIIESEMLIGKTKSEVRTLLGDEGNTEESDYWNYYLGFRPGFSNIDPDVLDIEFREDKVIKVGQHET